MLRPLLLAALLSTPSLAMAQQAPNNLGEQHYLAGVEAYGHQQYHSAAIEFRAAYELTAQPMLLFNLGNALAADGQRDAARDAFRRYLDATPDVPNRAAVEERLRELGPAGPPVAPVVQDTHPRTQTVVVPDPRVGVVSPTAPRSSLSLVGAVLGGAGIVAAGVGLGLYVDTSARYSQCQQHGCPEDQRPRGEDLAAVSLLWGGGALAVAGLVTFLVAPRALRAPASTTYLLVHPGGVGVGGVF